MRFRKIIFRVLIVCLLIGFVSFFWYAWRAFPIISGYGAKNLCSAIYLQHRDMKEVIAEDLAEFPLSIGSYTIHREDSSVTGSVWGFARRKAIYRRGAGCTLVNDIPETEIRKQHFSGPVSRPPMTDSVDWPLGDRVHLRDSGRIDNAAMELALNNVFTNTHKGKPTYTRAVVVLYDGELVAEKYAPGFTKNTVLLGWSVSKSLTSALIGVLVKQGKLQVLQPAPVPEWIGNEKHAITLQQLLQQTTGLDFREVYTGPSEVTNMLFKTGDMAAFTAKQPLKYKPGTVFSYSSGNSNILSRIIRHTVGESDYASFPYREFFSRVGMYSTMLEPDASGTYIGSSYSYATARDFARFGLLYYNNGMWNGEQVLPADWVQQTIQPAGADSLKRYGYQFWLNGRDEKNPRALQFPDVPADMFYADGYGGQNIFIIPSAKLVIVRMGLHVIDENKFLKEVISATRTLRVQADPPGKARPSG